MAKKIKNGSKKLRAMRDPREKRREQCLAALASPAKTRSKSKSAIIDEPRCTPTTPTTTPTTKKNKKKTDKKKPKARRSLVYYSPEAGSGGSAGVDDDDDEMLTRIDFTPLVACPQGCEIDARDATDAGVGWRAFVANREPTRSMLHVSRVDCKISTWTVRVWTPRA